MSAETTMTRIETANHDVLPVLQAKEERRRFYNKIARGRKA